MLFGKKHHEKCKKRNNYDGIYDKRQSAEINDFKVIMCTA